MTRYKSEKSGLAAMIMNRCKSEKSGLAAMIMTRVCGLDYPRDIVVLHSIPRDRLTPNLGNFSLKLETYLRVNAIPYQVEHVDTTFPITS
ncbi:hypothetical protein MAR_032270 [Mya arenaria]|uniref:Uncharacterized protein n=1 Tax=Mya arenaria TaxID=6604 RepID=A0ABY7FA53_MYAAR|nr:hypothetical protein MAR_032270 [Mya arenaria]